MKKLYILIAFLAGHQIVNGQVWLGVYGLRANTTATAIPEIGGGFAFSLMSDDKLLSRTYAQSPLRVQYGGNFYWSMLGHRDFYNVPLAAPQSGLAAVTLRNSFVGMNGLARLSLPNKSRFTPYGEVFLGYRGTFSTMSIDPGQRSQEYEEESSRILASAHGLNYGLGGGLTTHLTKSKRIRLDIGVSYIEQAAAGRYVHLASASADNYGINLSYRPAPTGILMMNVGLLFYIEDDGSVDDDECNCNCRHRSSAWVGGAIGGWSGSKPNNVRINTGGGGLSGLRAK